jgi:hypothetical protein
LDPRYLVARRALAQAAGALVLLGLAPSATGYQVAITAGSRALFLQVGTGTMTGGNFNAGGAPADNTTVNLVSVTLSAATLGTGPVTMTSNSAVANSPLNSSAFCAPPTQVYVGGFFRRSAAGAATSATLSVTTPASLLNASADTIPFTAISWISGGAGDATPTIPSGTFIGATQTLLTIPMNNWFESCLTFRYANSQGYAAGTFTGRATYTLSAP